MQISGKDETLFFDIPSNVYLDAFIFFMVATHSNLTAYLYPSLKYTTRCDVNSTRITMIVQTHVKCESKYRALEAPAAAPSSHLFLQKAVSLS